MFNRIHDFIDAFFEAFVFIVFIITLIGTLYNVFF